MRSPRFLFVGALVVAVLGADLSAAETVFVSIPPQAFLVDELAGDLVEVEVLLPPGASPATYEPTPRQLAALGRSLLYLKIGAPFEASVLNKIRYMMPDLEIVDCRRDIELEPIDSHDHGHASEHLDPHVWLDPERMKTIAETTARALQATLPAAAEEIARRLVSLHQAIDERDALVGELLHPLAGRTLVVFHPAYGYFVRRYGLVQKAVEAGGKSPSTRQLAAVVEELQRHDVPAIFVQPQFSRSTAERVAAALDCRVVELDPLARDYLANLQRMADRIAEALR